WYLSIERQRCLILPLFLFLSVSMKNKLTKSQKRILSIYIKLSKKNGVYPSRSELLREGVSRDQVRSAFGSLSQLKNVAFTTYPDVFKGIIDETLVSDDAIQNLKQEVRGYNKFVITTAIGGGKVHSKFHSSLKKYCELNNAKLLILMAEDPASIRKFKIPNGLEEEQFVFSDIKLNSNIFISTIKLSAKQIDPMTGLSRLGKREGSFIYASPKQRLVFVPIGSTLPHAIMTTGAITLPDYQTEHYMSERTAWIAKQDHVMGAVIVEVEDEEIYHFRQIQAEKNGSFIDLGKQYTENGVIDVRPSAFILGDWHSGETDPTAKTSWKEVVDAVKPRILVLHDAFNGKSINHHEKGRKIKRAKFYRDNLLSLKDELKKFAEDLNELSTWADQVVIVKSNHDEFLEEILEDGRYINDPINFEICTKLALAMLNGSSPLRIGAEISGLSATNIVWLKRDDDFEIARIQLGAHGDKGPNGARGSIKNLESSYGNCVIGHSHSPGILRGCWQVGTSSLFN